MQRLLYQPGSFSLCRSSDSGIYACVASNQLGSVRREVEVEVVPRVVAQKPLLKAGLPENRTLLLGEAAELRCELVVDDPATPSAITW